MKCSGFIKSAASVEASNEDVHDAMTALSDAYFSIFLNTSSLIESSSEDASNINVRPCSAAQSLVIVRSSMAAFLFFSVAYPAVIKSSQFCSIALRHLKSPLSE